MADWLETVASESVGVRRGRELIRQLNFRVPPWMNRQVQQCDSNRRSSPRRRRRRGPPRRRPSPRRDRHPPFGGLHLVLRLQKLPPKFLHQSPKARAQVRSTPPDTLRLPRMASPRSIRQGSSCLLGTPSCLRCPRSRTPQDTPLAAMNLPGSNSRRCRPWRWRTQQGSSCPLRTPWRWRTPQGSSCPLGTPWRWRTPRGSTCPLRTPWRWRTPQGSSCLLGIALPRSTPLRRNSLGSTRREPRNRPRRKIPRGTRRT